MPHPLDGARAKKSRALEHLGTLERDIAAYLKSKPIHVDNREERDGVKRHIQWVASATTEPPAEFGLIVGDWANDARAALDYTVYESAGMVASGVRGSAAFHDGSEARFHPLAILADVSNRDKHRLVHTVAMQVAGSQARVSGTSVMAIHSLVQNPGTVEEERVILDAVLETAGDDFRIELDVQLSVGLEGYEIPMVPMLALITNEIDAIVEWFAAAIL